MDIWERNHVVNEVGTETLVQAVLWRFEWYEGRLGYYCAAWTHDDRCVQPERVNGRWLGRFDGQWVIATLFVETWTAFDPEIADRKMRHEAKRKWEKKKKR